MLDFAPSPPPASPSTQRTSPMAHYHSPNPVGTVVEKVRRHPKYYLIGGDVHFLVENYLFRVHRYFFERESAWFREKLAIPAPAGESPKGSSDANPFHLEDVNSEDFARFLWVFYNPKYSMYDATIADWTDILKLAYDWRFAEVKKLCCRELEKFEIAPFDKIELYQLYELDKRLLIPSYIAICARPEPLSIKEGRQIGLETALLIATARECARGILEGGARSPGPVSCRDDDMVSIIRNIFGLDGPSSPSLSPKKSLSALESPSLSRFDPTLSPSKSTRSQPTLGSASATAVNTVMGGDVFVSSSTATSNGAAAPGQFRSKFSTASPLSRLTPASQQQELAREPTGKSQLKTSPVVRNPAPPTPTAANSTTSTLAVANLATPTAAAASPTPPPPAAETPVREAMQALPQPPPPPTPMVQTGKGRTGQEAKETQSPQETTQETRKAGTEVQVERNQMERSKSERNKAGEAQISASSSPTGPLQSRSNSQSENASTRPSASASVAFTNTSHVDATTPADSEMNDSSTDTQVDNKAVGDADDVTGTETEEQGAEQEDSEETVPLSQLSKSARKKLKATRQRLAKTRGLASPTVPPTQNARGASPEDTRVEAKNNSTDASKVTTTSEGDTNAAAEISTPIASAPPANGTPDASSSDGAGGDKPDRKIDASSPTSGQPVPTADGTVAAKPAALNAPPAADASGAFPKKDDKEDPGAIDREDKGPNNTEGAPSTTPAPQDDATNEAEPDAPAPPEKDTQDASSKKHEDKTDESKDKPADAPTPVTSDWSAHAGSGLPDQAKVDATAIADSQTGAGASNNESSSGTGTVIGTTSESEPSSSNDVQLEAGAQPAVDVQADTNSVATDANVPPSPGTGGSAEQNSAATTPSASSSGSTTPTTSAPPTSTSTERSVNVQMKLAHKPLQQQESGNPGAGMNAPAGSRLPNAWSQRPNISRPQTPEKPGLTVVTNNAPGNNSNAWGNDKKSRVKNNASGAGRGSASRQLTPVENQRAGTGGGNSSAKTPASGRAWSWSSFGNAVTDVVARLATDGEE